MNKKRILLSALVSSLAYGCIGTTPPRQESLPPAAELKSLEDFVSNQSIKDAVSVASSRGEPIYLLTSQNPPDISGNYILSFQGESFPAIIRNKEDGFIEFSPIKENCVPLNALVRGSGNDFTIYSSWQVSVYALGNKCEIESALIFSGQKDPQGNLSTDYISVPIAVVTPDSCGNPKGASGKASFTRN